MEPKHNPFTNKVGRALAKLLIKWYNLPNRKISVYNGVAVRNSHFLTKVDVYPNHEAQLIDAIRKYVKFGDTAVIVGGGTGSSTVVTAHQVGQKGTVTTYEGAENLIKTIQETIILNKVDDRVKIHHAVVEKLIYLLGEKGKATIVSASKLPNCNALIMDCEGAELPILENILIQPRLIIVETHTHFDSPSDKIEKILTNLNYEIVSKDFRSKDISVLTAIQKNEL